MSAASKITVTVLLLALIAGLGVTDALYSGKGTAFIAGRSGTDAPAVPAEAPAGNVVPQGVAKNNGPAIEQAAAQAGLELKTGQEHSILAGLIAGAAEVKSAAVLQDGDRAGSVTWTESPRAKIYYVSLKESLLSAFSDDVEDLEDVTRQEPGKPVVNMLRFRDPAISEETVVFLRVRERIYEFHLTPGKEAAIQALIDGVTA